jgi:shikimate dehydrogenase
MRRACVIGYPVRHSRSPLIHGFWLAEHGIDGSYERAEVAPAAFEDFVAGLEGRGFAGANVTVPHKEAAFRLAIVEDPVARALEAVNTLWLDKGRLQGANTDVAGFLANLDQERPGWDRDLDHVVLLGAGGAGRAVLHGVLDRGARRVTILNRTLARAEDLASRAGGKARAMAWHEAEAAFSDAALLVNATSLGMAGQPRLTLGLDRLPRSAVVTDIVYVPLETELLKTARGRGNPTVDGLGMLLHQAVPGFERWFGVRPSVSPELRRLIIDDLQRARVEDEE